jgi:hypothetical protein
VTEGLREAEGLLAAGDIPGLFRLLRAGGEALPLAQVARLVAGAAQLARFDDLVQAAAMVAGDGNGSGPQDALALYNFGYACTEQGASYLAVRPLVAALEQDGQHAPPLRCQRPLRQSPPQLRPRHGQHP